MLCWYNKPDQNYMIEIWKLFEICFCLKIGFIKYAFVSFCLKLISWFGPLSCSGFMQWIQCKSVILFVYARYYSSMSPLVLLVLLGWSNLFAVQKIIIYINIQGTFVINKIIYHYLLVYFSYKTYKCYTIDKTNLI